MDGYITLEHDFYCTCCGRRGIPIGRNMGNLKEKGHLKKLFCVNCNREVNHAEVIENSQYDRLTFIDEFKSGNFDHDGNRLIPLKEWNLLFYGNEKVIA